MKAPCNIIFLDIDGVVNTMDYLRRQKKESGVMSNNNWCPIACKHIMLLCEQFNARIVISSTWRYNHTPEELRDVLRDNDIDPDYMIGTTPALIYQEGTGSFVRGNEIAAWLNENDWGTYVIIDDLPESQFLKEQLPRLVRVEQEMGFAVKDAAIKAGEILGVS